MRIWLASPAELPIAAGLLAEFRDYYGRDVPGDEAMRANVERIAAEDGEFLLGAADSEEPAGVCQLRYRWSAWTSSEDCWLEDVFVRESARGGGLGRALIEAAIERARAHHCARIELDADDSNATALALYRSLEFREDLKADTHSLLLGRRLDD